MPECVFCQIVAGKAPADVVFDDEYVLGFKPLRPHVPGHVLFIPKGHMQDAAEDPLGATTAFFEAAAWVAMKNIQANIITSVGPDATQTVFHLHVHVIPRGPKDGLRKSWPWRLRRDETLGPGEVL